ncbi:MAG: hypothetical protein II538_00505, partial [Bacteroidaceae bacterium]|nr:hypothetical protein [Bacteroidaceae bacterium]
MKEKSFRHTGAAILCAIVLTMTAIGCQTKHASTPISFERGGWDSLVYTELNQLIAENAHKGNYAVFDFDKTTIAHDISNAVMIYQIEHLRFGDAVQCAFSNGIPAIKEPLNGIGISSAEMGLDIKKDYRQMQAMMDRGMTLEEVQQTDVYLDYRARFISFLDALNQTFPVEVWYAWMPGLLGGFTREEAKAVIRDALRKDLLRPSDVRPALRLGRLGMGFGALRLLPDGVLDPVRVRSRERADLRFRDKVRRAH